MNVSDMRREHGSITLEAAVFLSLFLMFYMALMDIIQIGRAQVILQYALNESAKEISQSTYLLTKTGIVDRSMSTNGKRKEFEGKTEEMVQSVIDLANAVSSGDITGACQNYQIAEGNVENYFGNSDDLLQGILATVKSAAAGAGKELAVEAATKGIVKKQLNYLCDEDADEYLEKLGIEGGLSGLDFSDTEWFSGSVGEIPEIKIVCTYTMKYKLAFIQLEERKFRLCAQTAVW